MQEPSLCKENFGGVRFRITNEGLTSQNEMDAPLW
jgi:hypothetical protein